MIGDTYQFQLGEFHCTIICDRNPNPDFEAAKRLFPNIPPDDLRAAIDQSGHPFASSINILFIRTPQHRILVDTSIGSENNQLLNSLQNADIDPAEIDLVILTHGHGDHIGGILRSDGALAFPNARYVAWNTEWEYLITEAEQNAESLPHRVLLPIRDKVSLINHDSEIVPGVYAVPTPGHTVGHMAILLDSDGERLVHIVDAAHFPMQAAHPDWSPAFDRQPELAAQTRRALFERIAQDHLLMMGYHLPFPGLGHITPKEGAFWWEAQPR